MKIENGIMSPVAPVGTSLHKPEIPAATETAQPAKNADEAFNVELSTKAEQLNKPQSADEISQDKIAAIRDKLAAGAYNISGKDVANKILNALKA
jgi:flagellar biosynthesis anti-sigma factor FlgM